MGNEKKSPLDVEYTSGGIVFHKYYLNFHIDISNDE
jgi:hypothetical protein